MKTRLLIALVLGGCAADADDAAPGDAAPVPADAAPADAAPPACPAPRRIRECFRGLAFADCGGDGDAVRFCRSGPDHDPECLWFTGGCPAAEYPDRCVPEDQGQPWAPCPVVSAFEAFGQQPWTRDRDMNLTLRVDPTVEPGEPDVGCAGPCGAEGAPPTWPDGKCWRGTSLCAPDDPEAQWDLYGPWRSPAPDDAEWSLPSLVAVRLGRSDGFTGQQLVLELDFERGTARACAHETSDVPDLGDSAGPPCADVGEVVVDRVPATAADVAGLHGRFDVSFPKFSPVRDHPPFVTGWRLVGAF
jgi:hypothetical protein